MITKKVFKKISVEASIHKELIKDRDHFQKVIGGGRWSISDTIREYKKIMKNHNKTITSYKK